MTATAMMAAAVRSLPVSAPRLEIRFSQGHLRQFQKLTPSCNCSHRLIPTYSAKVKRLQFSKHMVKMQVSNGMDRAWDAVPEEIRDFPWRKTKEMVLQQSQSLGLRALQWTFLILYIFVFVLDVIVSISRNNELLIPTGLFAGCIIAGFLKEVSQELFHDLEGEVLRWNLLGIGCFLVLVKISATHFVKGPLEVFLLHVANGGLMQILWLWKSSIGKQGVACVSPAHNPSRPMDLGN